MNREPSLSPMTFGEMLRFLRKRIHLSQEQLARALGYSRTLITHLENGQRMPDLALVKTSFVEALGLSRDPDLAKKLITLAQQTARHTAESPNDASPSHVLPQPQTRLVGRAHEIAELTRHITTQRLVTLTGSGGVGKTRLAVEVCRAVAATGIQPISFVELAPVSDPGLVATALCATLGIQSAPAMTPEEQLLIRLKSEHGVVTLDNCEHVIDACAQLVQLLLSKCPELRVLTTSREALGVPGERVWRVPALSTPDASGSLTVRRALDFEAVQLFAERAAESDATFTLRDDAIDSIAGLCRRLNGIPLAIEMAAALVAECSISELTSTLGARLDTLIGAERHAPSRHQTMRATIDWSYALLSTTEKRLFERLSVFSDGCTLHAMEAICGGAGATLRQLARKSLVVADTNRAETRYRLLEVVREFAAERLSEYDSATSDHLRDRHLSQ